VAEDKGHSGQDLDLSVDDVKVAVAESGTLNADENLPCAWRWRRYVLDNQFLPVLM
jgi:hypothetical protein